MRIEDTLSPSECFTGQQEGTACSAFAPASLDWNHEVSLPPQGHALTPQVPLWVQLPLPVAPIAPRLSRSSGSRGLAPGELAMARDYFGDTIDYTKIKIFHRRYFPLQPSETVMSPNGNIYYARSNEDYLDDFSNASPEVRAQFMHELLHVWQYQRGRDVIMEGLALHLGYGNPYHYELHSASSFSDYTIEQQATIMEDYYFLLQGLLPERAKRYSREDYRRVLEDVFPLPLVNGAQPSPG